MKRVYALCCIIILLLSNITYGVTPVLFFKKNISKKKYLFYRVKKGEYLYEILRRIGIPENKIAYLIKDIKRLNPQIKDLNNLHVGDILKIPRLKAYSFSLSSSLETQSLKQLKKRYPFTPKKYTIKKGDVLTRLLARICGIPKDLIYNEYLLIFKKLNPHIKDIGSIPVGSSIVLPVYRNFKFSSPTKKIIHPHDNAILFLILKKLGFKIYINDTFVIPSKKGGWIIVDTSKNPLIESPSNKKIILIEDKKFYNRYKSKGNIEVILQKNSIYDMLKNIANLCKEITIWERGENLIINSNQFVVESRGDIQIIKYLTSGGYKYYIFFLSPMKLDYTQKLCYHYLARHNIFIYTMSMDRTSFINPLSYINGQIYSPRLPEVMKVQINSKFMRRTNIEVKIREGVSIFIPVYEIGKYYVLPNNSPELIAILRLRGYDCYGF